MTIEERAEQGAQLKKSGACNCCQAVAAVLADQAGLSQEALMQIASGFGVGMGNMEATCGASSARYRWRVLRWKEKTPYALRKCWPSPLPSSAALYAVGI